MRKVFEAFPEVLRVDGASTEEKKTESNYRVFSLMAHDTLGSWQYVQHAIVENDRSETLRAALDQFKVHNAHHSRIRALIVPSEDSVQLEELRANFPAARVLYSQFHVVRALHKAIAEHGKDLTSWHRDRLTGIAQLLVYAPTPVVYGANIAVMAEVLGSKQHPFFCFFLDKWDSCRDRWSTFAREGVTTFSISENDGQFAPTWRSIFTAANGELALDETVAAIRYYQAVVERAFIRDLNLAASSVSNAAGASSDSNNEYDAEMRLLAATVSPAASSLIFPQYRYAISRGAYQFCEPLRGSFFVSAVAPNDIFCDELSKEFCVEAERRWQCSCAFMVNHHLPCRHVFYIRRIVRCSCVIPVEHIEPRWVLAKAQDFFNPLRGNGVAGSGENGIGLDQDDHRHVVAPPGAWQKFVTAQEVGKRISQRMMEMDPEEFDRALHFYNLVETTLNVRPFDLNSAAVARLNSEGGRFVSQPAQRRPNWVEPDPTRTLAPRAVVGRMYASANDRIAAEVAAGTFQQAQLTKRSQPNRTGTQSAEVIDLQGESEEEEKENSLQQGDAAGDETQRDQEHGDNGVQHLQAKSGPVEQLESLGGGQTVASTGGDVESNTADQNTTHNDSYADEVVNTVNQSEPNSSNAVPDDRPGREPWESIDDPDNYSEMHEAKATSPPRSPGFAN
ncbi:unnamed protein product [Phytophthora lilii]|uniref:Unnamed protein product n=1 Tax=Phytophthora lilii TaxID=2077276 RepID=A0A9W6XF09_9STRA|nr:unnamed protein product [Phytophthora lilii]